MILSIIFFPNVSSKVKPIKPAIIPDIKKLRLIRFGIAWVKIGTQIGLNLDINVEYEYVVFLILVGLFIFE